VASLSKCRITVLRRTFDRELIAQFIDDGHADMAPCEVLRDGQEFIVEQFHQPPEGFCSWAWADIRQAILRVAAGADFPWMRERGVEIAGCSDWFRPVIFKIERIE
jgi:uncharacterized repeat protein (TIGR04076 family)